MTKNKFSRLLAVILDDKTYENKSKILLNINRNLALYSYYIKQVESKCHNFLNEAKIHNFLKYIYIYVLCIQKLLYCAWETVAKTRQIVGKHKLNEMGVLNMK